MRRAPGREEPAGMVHPEYSFFLFEKAVSWVYHYFEEIFVHRRYSE